MIVRRATADHLPWLAERAGISLSPGLAAMEAVAEDGTVKAMVGYDGWLGGACQMHVASESPMALMRLVRPCFRLAFLAPPHGCGLAAIIAPVIDGNEASHRLVQGLGFKAAFHGKDWVRPGTGITYYEMRREDCRFLGRSA